MVLSREFTDAVRVNMITKKDFDYIKDAASREDSFDWDIPNGYILFRKIGMTVCRLKKGTWYTKHVNFWRELSYTQLMEKLKEQEWIKEE